MHGTGVREPEYTQTFKEVSQALTNGEKTLTVLPCYWGGEYGTRRHANGASIPQYDTTRSIAPTRDDIKRHKPLDY